MICSHCIGSHTDECQTHFKWLNKGFSLSLPLSLYVNICNGRVAFSCVLAHHPCPMTSSPNNATIHTDVAYKTWI